MIPVIVVFGKMGSGKDTFADALGKELGAVRMAFADPVKAVAKDLLGIPYEVSYGTQRQKEDSIYYGHSTRKWLQWIGCEYGREVIDEDIWVHRAVEEILTYGGKDGVSPPFVISDGRYPNELTALSHFLSDEFQVLGVRVKRADQGLKHTEHSSETEQDEMPDSSFAHVVENFGTVEQLLGEAHAFGSEVIRGAYTKEKQS